LGLGVLPEDDSLRAGLAGLCEFRHWRAEEIARKLDQAGIAGALEGAVAEAGEGSLISRTHFARFLVKNGYAKDFRQVFKRYLVQRKPGHVTGQWAPSSSIFKDPRRCAIVPSSTTVTPGNATRYPTRPENAAQPVRLKSPTNQ